MRIQAEMHQWSGPLPQPEALERYNQILPGAAERILSMAETQHEHRLTIETNVIDSGVAAQKLGTILGFVIVMTVVIGGMFLIFEGKSTAGLAAVISSLTALVGVFVYSKREQQKDLANKTKNLAVTARRQQ